jgi:D-3-phosphoglycerate dehydrogenase
MTADGQPCCGVSAFDVLKGNREIEWEWVPEDLDVMTPDIAARYDGLHLNAPRVTAATLSRGDCRLKIIARNGVGFDTVDLDAATAKGIVVTNTPIAVRRPVAVATLTMLFALAARLLKKNELVHTGRWNDRANFMGQGLTGRTLGLIGAGGIGQEILGWRVRFRAHDRRRPYIDAGMSAAHALGRAARGVDAHVDSSWCAACSRIRRGT